MKIKKQDVLADGSKSDISLSKLTGKKVVDAIGYVSGNFGFPVFKVTDLVFDDGTTIGLDGEHDIAFIPQGRDDKMPPNMDEDTLSELGE